MQEEIKRLGKRETIYMNLTYFLWKLVYWSRSSLMPKLETTKRVLVCVFQLLKIYSYQRKTRNDIRNNSQNHLAECKILGYNWSILINKKQNRDPKWTQTSKTRGGIATIPVHIWKKSVWHRKNLGQFPANPAHCMTTSANTRTHR